MERNYLVLGGIELPTQYSNFIIRNEENVLIYGSPQICLFIEDFFYPMLRLILSNYT